MPTPTATPEAEFWADWVGFSRSKPIPRDSMLGGYMPMAITDVIRSSDEYTSPGAEPMDHVYITMRFECSLPNDERCTVDPFDFSLTGSTGLVREVEWIMGAPGALERTEFYTGAIVEGLLMFTVAEGEDDLILMFCPFLSKQTVFFTVE